MVTTNVRLLSPIGEGAMGSVWLAEHLTLETEVAVKFIHEDLQAERNEAVARFQREAAAAAKIRSPHIVQVFDQGQMVDGTPYIVMELLQGESLEDRLGRVQRLSMRQTAQIVSQVAKGLRAAHAAGVIHRDIKPANIFLVPHEDGKLIKLVDFGVAKAVKMPESRKLTQDGLLVGTPEYICRDQIASTAPADFQTDLWALAIVAYECLIGEVPFGGSTVGMVCANILLGKFGLPSSLRSDLPPGLDAWFTRCFAEDPAERFPSARELALAFLRLLPTRTSDIEADLLDRGTANFSLVPPSAGAASSSRRGTEIGLVVGRDGGTLRSPDDGGDPDWKGELDDDEVGDFSLEVARTEKRSLDPTNTGSAQAGSADRARASTTSESALDIAGMPARRTHPGMVGALALAVAVAGAASWLALRVRPETSPSPASLVNAAASTLAASPAPAASSATVAVALQPASSPIAAVASSAAPTAEPASEVKPAESLAPAVAPPTRSGTKPPRESAKPGGGKPPPRPVVSKPSSGEGDDLGF